MSNKLARVDGGALLPASFQEARAVAIDLSKARGFIPDAFVDNPGAVLAVLMTGAELGIGPMEAMRGIHIMKGKPMLSADLMLRLALRAGVRHSWRVTTNTEARIDLSRAGHDAFTMSFTIDDAKRAGLAGKDTWKSYPAAMLRARCISAALRAYCPDVLGAGVYVEGEIEEEQPARPVAVVREAPRSEPHDEPEIEDGEIISDDPPPPRRLDDCCGSIEALRDWCEREGQAAMDAAGPERVEATVRKRAVALGATEQDVMRWLHGEQPAEGGDRSLVGDGGRARRSACESLCLPHAERGSSNNAR